MEKKYGVSYRTPRYDYTEVGEKVVMPEWRKLPSRYTKHDAHMIVDAFKKIGVKASLFI